MKDIKVGDHFLLPYTGSQKARLIRVVGVSPNSLWIVETVATGNKTYCYVPSCHRVSPAKAKKIMGVA